MRPRCADGGPIGPFWDAAQALDPEVETGSVCPGSRAGHLADLFRAAGIGDIVDSAVAVDVEHATFEDWWEPFTLGVAPSGAHVAGLEPDRRRALRELLADPAWLPREYRESAPESGMGGGIGQWLLFRAGDRSLSLFSLVVPPGAQTPVHDHLAWGLVGLYRGSQDEEIYAERDDRLEVIERRRLVPGDFYALLPPANDIHRVRTT